MYILAKGQEVYSYRVIVACENGIAGVNFLLSSAPEVNFL